LRAAERVIAQGRPSEAALAAFQHLLEDEARHPAALIAARGERARSDFLMHALQGGEITLSEHGTILGIGDLGGGSIVADRLSCWIAGWQSCAFRAERSRWPNSSLKTAFA
jgi:hypothetical protein